MKSSIFLWHWLLLLCIISFAKSMKAQIPQTFKYQTAIRDNSGNLLANKLIALKISILRTSASGILVYSESHNVSTTDFGIANINIGNGTVIQGNFNQIDWGNGPYFLKTELDVNNGNNFLFMGTTQLLSVPYALYAAKSANAENDFDKDSLNEVQQIGLNGNQLQLTKSGGTVNLDKYIDNTDSQSLSLQGNTLSISRGNSIILSGVVDLDSDPTNELQSLSTNKDTLRLSKSNFVVLPKDNDADSLNEIQTLAINGSRLNISKGNQIVVDPDTTNELQTLYFNGSKIGISKGNELIIDKDSTNELQALYLSGDTLFLSKSNFVKLSNVILGSQSKNLDAYGNVSEKVVKLIDTLGSYTFFEGNNVLIDSSENIYCSGNYSNNLTTGGIKIYSGTIGFFITKFNSFGQRLWVVNFNNLNLKILNVFLDRNQDIVILAKHELMALRFNIIKISKSGTINWNTPIDMINQWQMGPTGTHVTSSSIAFDNSNNIYTVNTTSNINSNQSVEILKINTNNGSIMSTIPITTGNYGWFVNFTNILFDGTNSLYLLSGINLNRDQSTLGANSSILMKVKTNGTILWRKDWYNFNNGEIFMDSLSRLFYMGPYEYCKIDTSNGNRVLDFTTKINENKPFPVITQSSNNNNINISFSGTGIFNENYIFQTPDGFSRFLLCSYDLTGKFLNVGSVLISQNSELVDSTKDFTGNSYFIIRVNNGMFNCNGITYKNGLFLIKR
jgi:hypothetical protein